MLDETMRYIAYCALSLDSLTFEKACALAVDTVGEKFADALKSFRDRNRERFLEEIESKKIG